MLPFLHCNVMVPSGKVMCQTVLAVDSKLVQHIAVYLERVITPHEVSDGRR